MAKFENTTDVQSGVKTGAQTGVQAQKPMKEQDVSISHKVGDAVERVGEKLKDMGAEKIGSAVYNAGNKLEHSDEAKKH